MDNILEKIYKSGLKLLVPSTPEKTYETVLEEAMKLVGADTGTLALKVSGEFKIVSGVPTELATIKPRKKGYTYKSFITNKPFIVDAQALAKIHPQMRGMSAKSSIFIPLSYQNKAVGVIVVDTKEKGKFSTRELEILVLFGSMASLAIRKAHLFDETKQALETRDLFISMAAHELRTPLTTISGYIQLLAHKFTKENTDELKWINELTWETNRLAQLANELLSVTRINSGSLSYSFNEKSFIEITERAVTNFQFSHPEHQVKISNSIEYNKDRVVCDFDKLLQVIDNILDNAAKFSSPGSKVELSIYKKSSFFIFKVVDHGKGISKTDLPNVFKNYYRGSGHSHEGMGIGLFLAKNIITKHHGDINIKSKLRKGTTVEIKLPILSGGKYA